MRKSLPGIDNGRQQQYAIQVLSLLWQHIKCAAKHIDGCKGENPESYDSIEYQSTKQVFADPLTKGLLPKSTWVLREAYNFWIAKGPKERLRFCFNTEKCIVAVNQMVSDNCHDEARPTYRSAMR